MEWEKIYRPERKADWADIAGIIRDSVSMDDVLRFYAPGTPTRNRRCPCPFHNGKDFNFSFTRSGYKCFVCGVSGDVIAFVKDSLRLSTRAEAMKRINADLRLHLPIDSNITALEGAEISRLRAEREAKERAQEEWRNTYHALLDEWVQLDKTKRNANPMSSAYAEAVKRIDYIAYQLDSLPSEPR